MKKLYNKNNFLENFGIFLFVGASLVLVSLFMIYLSYNNPISFIYLIQGTLFFSLSSASYHKKSKIIVIALFITSVSYAIVSFMSEFNWNWGVTNILVAFIVLYYSFKLLRKK